MNLTDQLLAITAMFVNFFFPLLSLFVFMSKGVKIAQQTEHHPLLYGIGASIVGLLIGFAFAVGINFVIERGPNVCVRKLVCSVLQPSGRANENSCGIYECRSR